MNINNRPLCKCSQTRKSDTVNRRAFLMTTGLGAVALAAGAPGMAMPPEASEFEKLVSPNKKLSPEWVQSLFTRGMRTVYRGAELEKIGMPVGGICTGQVYLGGDGKLWHWDIFNSHIHTEYEHYPDPPIADFPFEQGFAIRIRSQGKDVVRALDRSGFADIAFTGEYPIGYVEYCDPESPISVSLEAFSPFIPLDPHDSGLPATILRFTVKNTSAAKAECELAGWLENAVCHHSVKSHDGSRTNTIFHQQDITLLDCTAGPPIPLENLHDFGSMSLALLDAQPDDLASAAVTAGVLPRDLFDDAGLTSDTANTKNFPESIIGAVARNFVLEPNQQTTVTFVVAWHFPNILHLDLKDIEGRQYGKRFASSRAVVEYIAVNGVELSRQTRLWHDTWYDSSLPYWFLDRTFLNTSTLATSTVYWFGNDRFYGWEGVGCCEGTCAHVWHYAQAVAHIFPSLERGTREMVDYGIAFHPQSGVIGFRAEFDQNAAVDGQAGTILRVYREHQMSPDSAFLERNWPKIKKSLEFLMQLDTNQDGILDGKQMNTLDCQWYGQIAWLSSLYVAALRAGEQMAIEMHDEAFAQKSRTLAEAGTRNIDEQLFNGEYFVQVADKDHAQSVGSYDGCEIDQVFGQSWAWQVGLGRILPRENTLSALRSLWKYNFTPDVGAYRNANRPGRWFAMPGEGGLIMCTWPRSDKSRVQQGFDYYFNECMTGFEYQVAGHMIWEGMVQEGLAIVRTIHDRYHASRRNPWNEVECGDHYARAMASYGVFLAACGFEYHGPKGYLAFAPRLTPENFKAAFTTAEGWGTFRQERSDTVQHEVIELKWGKLRLRSLAFQLPRKTRAASVHVTAGDKAINEIVPIMEDDRVRIMLPEDIVITAGEKVEVAIGLTR